MVKNNPYPASKVVLAPVRVADDDASVFNAGVTVD